MNKGTINTRIIKRSILKHIARNEIAGTDVGTDYSVLDKTSSPSVLIAAVGISDGNAEMAYIRAVNNLATSGAKPEKIMINIQAGEKVEEQTLRDMMHGLTELVKNQGVIISGGNTVSFGEGEDCTVTITAFGKTDEKVLKQLSEKARADDIVIIIGDAGHYGASLICKNKDMADRFARSYIEKAIMPDDKRCISDVCDALIEGGVHFIHDVSFGGIYRNLVELAEHTGLGVDVLHEKVPIRQDTIEVAEYCNINPYELLGTGGVTALCHQENLERLEDVLIKRGITYSVAGRLTTEKIRLVHSEDNKIKRSLNFYEGDEIFKVL